MHQFWVISLKFVKSEVLSLILLYLQIHRSKQYSKKLLEMLTIHWEVASGRGSGRHGTLTLEGIPLPATSIPLMRPLPILFSK